MLPEPFPGVTGSLFLVSMSSTKHLGLGGTLVASGMIPRSSESEKIGTILGGGVPATCAEQV